MGINKIKELLPDFCKQAGVTSRYTGHCLRTTFISKATNAGISDQDVIERSKHKRVESLSHYKQPTADAAFATATKFQRSLTTKKATAVADFAHLALHAPAEALHAPSSVPSALPVIADHGHSFLPDRPLGMPVQLSTGGVYHHGTHALTSLHSQYAALSPYLQPQSQMVPPAAHPQRSGGFAAEFLGAYNQGFVALADVLSRRL